MENSDISIVRWERCYNDDFVRLNKEWIERFFRLEPCDLKLFAHPEEEIIRKGGEIFFARYRGETVGCCALVCHPETGRYELAKMAVNPSAQGMGIGTRLGHTLLDYARVKGIRSLYLEANTRLEASVKLYHALGFRPVVQEHPVYSRCDLYMEWQDEAV